jgi:hypothetical protein
MVWYGMAYAVAVLRKGEMSIWKTREMLAPIIHSLTHSLTHTDRQIDGSISMMTKVFLERSYSTSPLFPMFADEEREDDNNRGRWKSRRYGIHPSY